MKIKAGIEGQQIDIEVPDDATPDEIDEIVNSEHGASRITIPESAKDPSWYDVPGKLMKTAGGTLDKIKKEADLTASGKQSPFAGGVYSVLHMVSNPIEQIGNILSPIVSNPVSKAGFEGAGYVGNQDSPLELAKSNPKNREVLPPQPMPKVIQKTAQYLKDHPEVANRLESGANVGGMFVGSPVAKGAGEVTTQALKTTLEKSVPDVLEGFATRSQNRSVKINSPEWNMGARPELNAKYGVIGKKADAAAQHWEAIKQPIFESLDKKIAGQLDNPENFTNLEDLRNHAVAVINKSNADKDWKRLQIESLNKRIGDPNEGTGLYTTYADGKIDISEAQKLKIRTGRDGAWYSSGKGAMSDPEAPLKSLVANALYDALKVNVENKGSAGIKELNKALSEIIPMQIAAEKRMMVDKRSNFTSLDDVIAVSTALASAAHGNIIPALFAGGNMAVKSPLMARFAYGTAKALRGEKIPPGIKAIQDAIAMPERGKVINASGPFPITDKKRLLPGLKIGDMPPIENMEIPVGAKIRNMGKFEDIPVPERTGLRGLPSPEEIKKLYPHLSQEDIRAMAFKFNDRRALPAPMVETNRPGQVMQGPLPSVGDRVRSIGQFEDITPKFDPKAIENIPAIKMPVPDETDPFYKALLTKGQLRGAAKNDAIARKFATVSGDYPDMSKFNPSELLTLPQMQEIKYAEEMVKHQKDLARAAKQGNKAERSVLGEVQKGTASSKDAGGDAAMIRKAADGPGMRLAAQQFGYDWPLSESDYMSLMRDIEMKRKGLK